MKKLIVIAGLVVLAAAGVVFGAAGDKATVFVPMSGTLANSTSASKAAGEMRYNASYLYVNISTAARPHWRRIAVGSAF